MMSLDKGKYSPISKVLTNWFLHVKPDAPSQIPSTSKPRSKTMGTRAAHSAAPLPSMSSQSMTPSATSLKSRLIPPPSSNVLQKCDKQSSKWILSAIPVNTLRDLIRFCFSPSSSKFQFSFDWKVSKHQEFQCFSLNKMFKPWKNIRRWINSRSTYNKRLG